MWLGWWNKKKKQCCSLKYKKKPKEIQIFCHQKKKIKKLKIMGSPNSVHNIIYYIFRFLADEINNKKWL